MIESGPAALLTFLVVAAALVLGQLIGPLGGLIGIIIAGQLFRFSWSARRERQALTRELDRPDLLGGEQFKYPRPIKVVGHARFWFDCAATTLLLVGAGVLNVSTPWRVTLLAGGLVGCWRVWRSAWMLRVLDTIVAVPPGFIAEIQPNGSRIVIPFESVSLLRDENGNVLVAFSAELGLGIDLNPKREAASRMYQLVAQQVETA